MNQTKIDKTLLLLSTQLSNLRSDSDYEGSEQYLALDLATYNLLNDIFTTDVAEDAAWATFSNKAHAHEIVEFSIRKILDSFPEFYASGRHLYVVAVESFYKPLSNNWVSVLTNTVEVDIWDQSHLTVDMGWSEEEAMQLSDLEVFQSVHCYSDFAHSIFRIQ